MKGNRIFLLVDLTWLNVIFRMIYLYVLYIYTERYSVILVSLLLHIKLWYTLLLENFIKFFPSCICRWPLLEIITSLTCDFSNNCLDEQNWYFEGVFLVSITFDSCNRDLSKYFQIYKYRSQHWRQILFDVIREEHNWSIELNV